MDHEYDYEDDTSPLLVAPLTTDLQGKAVNSSVVELLLKVDSYPGNSVGTCQVKEKSLQHCGCHGKFHNPADTKARNKLVAACVIAFLFMMGEIIGKFN